MDVNSIPDRIATLCRQESTTYKCESYLSPEFQRQHSNETTILEAFPSASPCTETPGTACNAGRINEFWREKICEWSYQVIDHFDFNREVVAVSLSYLDRFLCTRTVTKKVFQLAAMSSLYMAIKLYEPTTLKISSFIELSRGYFTVDHIIAMEETILR
jgi:lipoyl(octanoyl) transferase